MDLREYIKNHPDNIFGHETVSESLNVEKEYSRFSRNPLDKFLNTVKNDDASFINNDIKLYQQAYSNYILTYLRVLRHCSLARRAEQSLHGQRARKKSLFKINKEIKSTGEFQLLDYQNILIHACILLNRTITLSRRFLRGKNLPSFTSFSQHKIFLRNNPEALDNDFKEYRNKIINTTDWYEIPLKILRDKYLMHSAERHMSLLGWSSSQMWEQEMIVMISNAKDKNIFFESVKIIVFSPRRLARDLDEFLKWFSENALKATSNT